MDPNAQRMFRVALWQISQPFVFFLDDIISSFTRSLTLSLSNRLIGFLPQPLHRFNRTPPWSGRGWGASGRPASPGTGYGSESETRPWSRRKTGRWCGSATGGSCRRKPLRKRRKQGTQQSCGETLPDIFRLESSAASHTDLLSCLWRIFSARRGFWTSARLCVPKGLSLSWFSNTDKSCLQDLATCFQGFVNSKRNLHLT